VRFISRQDWTKLLWMNEENRQDAEAYLALWAEDMEIEIPGRKIVRGKAAYAEMIHKSFATMRPQPVRRL
jgi:ketosteroid isomerase-like protein